MSTRIRAVIHRHPGAKTIGKDYSTRLDGDKEVKDVAGRIIVRERNAIS
jgi:hypothetical protein